MFTYCYDDQYQLYCVFKPSGAIAAMFGAEIEAMRYCDKHNKKAGLG